MELTALQQLVHQMYIAYYQRPADPDGLQYWVDQLEQNGDWTAVSAAFGAPENEENQALYGDLNREQTIAAIYQSAFNREAVAEEVAFWAASEFSATDLTFAIVNGAQNSDKATVDNKVAFSAELVAQVGTNAAYAELQDPKALLTAVTEETEVTAGYVSDAVASGKVGEAFSLTADVTGETLIGTSGSDTFEGSAAAYDNQDQVVDASTADNDTYNLALTGNATPKVVNVENVNITTSVTNGTNPQITASSMSGVEVLTVTGGDVVVGGSTIAGDKDVDVTGLDASKVAKLVAGEGTKDVTLVQATKAGAEVDASTATGAIAITGAASLAADNAASTVNFTALGNAAEDAKAISVDAAKATSVTTAAGFTGSVAINAANAGAVTVNGAEGGATIDAQKASADIDVLKIDDSGATITAGSGTSTDSVQIRLGGSTGSNDAATVSAAGKYVDLVTNQGGAQVENLTLSGNGEAVTYNVTGTATSYTFAGDQDVTIKDSAADFDGVTVTDSSSATTVVDLNGAVGGAEDLSKVAADKIKASVDLATTSTDTLTLASGANLEIAADQTDIFLDGKTTDATVNVSTGDDTNASGATIDISVAAFDAATNFKTVNLDATTGKFTATGTTLASTATLNIAGTKDVVLGTVVAKEVNASALTGKLNLTSATTATITSGAGADTMVLNDANGATTKFTVDAGAGNNDITVDNAKEASSISTGAGDDKIKIAEDNAIVVVTGAGNDTVTISDNVNSDAIVVAGDGASDTLVISDTNGTWDHDNNNMTAERAMFVDNTNFNFSGFETIDISALTSGSIQISAAQFNNQAFTLKGNATADNLKIVGTDSADTIDASNVTVDTAMVTLTGGKGNDTITGTSSDDTILFDFGSDTIAAGAGSDTLDASANIQGASASAGTGSEKVAGVIVNLGTTAVSEASIQAQTGNYLGGSATEVASGTANLGYAADKTTNISEVDSLSGILNVTGSAGADYIVGNAAGNTITGGAGNDYIALGAGADTVVIDSDATTDTVASFSAGSGGDQVALDISAAEGGSLDLVFLDDAASVATDGSEAVAFTTITGATDLGAAATANSQVLIANLTANIASTDALETALEVGGGLALTVNQAWAVNDFFYAAYDDGTDTYIAKVVVGGDGAADSETFATGELTATNVAKLAGISDVGTLDVANFDFIA